MCLVLDKDASEQQCIDFFDEKMHMLLSRAETGIRSVCAAVSGGSDSMFLLWMLARWRRRRKIKLYCVTVDHRLRDESREEAEFVQSFCKKLQVEHEILSWVREDEIAGHGKLENLAREVRYRLISEYCRQKNIGTVCTAHNWGDQLETYEIRKNFIGAENKSFSKIGLAGMSQIRSLTEKVVLIRPVLHFTKQCMRNILAAHCIDWKNDPMNEDVSFKRVQCRKKLSLENDAEKTRLKNIIFEFGKKRHADDAAAVEFLHKSTDISNFGYAVIPYSKFLEMPRDVQREVLRRLLWTIGGKKYPPVISDNFLDSAEKKRTEVLRNCLITHKKQKLFVFREFRNIEKIQWDKTTGDFIWDNRFYIDAAVVNELLKNVDAMTAKKSEINFLLTNDDVLLEELPREAVRTLPRVAADIGEFVLCSGIKFIRKVNLFDVFV